MDARFQGLRPHKFTLTFRAWPRETVAHKLSKMGKRWLIDGPRYNSNQHLEFIHFISEAKKAFGAWEISDADMRTFLDIGTSGAKFGEIYVRCAGTSDHSVKQECWLDIEVIAYPNAPKPKTPVSGGGMGKYFFGTEEELKAKFGPRYIFVDRPHIRLLGDWVKVMVEQDAYLVFDERRVSGVFAKKVREKLVYWVDEGKANDEDGGLFRGYQLHERVVRWRRYIGNAAGLEMAHQIVRAKGDAARRAYFVEMTVKSFAEKFGISQERVMARFLDAGIIEWLLRSFERIPLPKRAREKSVIYSRPIHEAMRAIECYIEGVSNAR